MTDDDEPMNFEEVASLKNLDEQIDQRLRERLRPSDQQEPLDPQLLRDLQAVYQSHAERFQSGLDRVWGRLGQHDTAPLSNTQQPRNGPIDRPTFRYERQHPMQRIFRTEQRWPARVTTLVAVALLAVLVGGLILGLILVHGSGGSPTGSPQNQTTTTRPQASPTSTSTPFTVTSVDLAVTPASIDGMACGSSVSFSYTATFHIPEGTAGGTVQFSYTVNNGRGSSNASVTVGPGQTTQTYTFTSSGTLSPDHTYPGIAEIMVNSPNAVNSPQVAPTGACATSAAFQVVSIDMAVNPASIAGRTCGTMLIVTYTATFHIAANSPGGTIQFSYTVNNGRGASNDSITVAPGQTLATYSFTWSGSLPPDHTAPGAGGVMTSAPNAVTSPLVAPAGRCS